MAEETKPNETIGGAGKQKEPATKPPGGDPPEENAQSEEVKRYGSALRKLLGLKEDAPLDNVDTLVADYRKQAELKLKVANDRLIAAEIKALSGYDTKLLQKVMDRNAISVNEKGEVVGVKEAAEAAAKEFPAVVAKTSNEAKNDIQPFHPVGSDSGAAAGKTMNDFIREAAGR